jgi:hypothetical protein
MSQPPLFGAKPRRGISRRQLDVTLLAWRKAGTCAGDEHAALRDCLRSAASAVDVARAAMHDGGSPYTVAVCTRIYAELLRQALEGVTPTDDLDDLLAAFAGDGSRA